MKIQLLEQSFSYIEVYKCRYDLDANNRGPVFCRDCKHEIGAGIGIHRRAYRRSGYLCFACFSKDVTILTTRFDGGDSGFFIDSLGRLRACSLIGPEISTPDVINTVYNALLDEVENSVYILLGPEAEHIWKIADTAEAVIGKS